MGRSRYEVIQTHNVYFATCTTVSRLPIFSRPELAQIVLDSLNIVTEQRRLTLHAFVLLEDHLHLVATSANFAVQIGRFKSFTARAIVDCLTESGPRHLLNEFRFRKKLHKTAQTHQLWQEGFHPEAIVGSGMLEQKVQYT